MNTIATSKRHRVWPWILGIVLTPFVAVGFVIAGALRLNSEATALRREIMTATGGHWHAKVQLSVPPTAVSLARTVVSFIHDVPPEAREALRAVRSACVGVYERDETTGEGGRDQIIAETDKAMAHRGWVRAVGVVDGKDTVLIYLPEGRGSAKPSRVCLAVCSGRELVIVAAGFDADTLARLVTREIGAGKFVKL
jgi:hypothetical protein